MWMYHCISSETQIIVVSLHTAKHNYIYIQVSQTIIVYQKIKHLQYFKAILRELGYCNEDVIQAVRVLVFGDGSGDDTMPLCSLSKRRCFNLYVQVIDELCGWLFIFDQTHYSRWLPLHVKDMVELEKKHPHVLEEFRKGNFVVFTHPQRSQPRANNQALQKCIRSCQSR